MFGPLGSLVNWLSPTPVTGGVETGLENIKNLSEEASYFFNVRIDSFFECYSSIAHQILDIDLTGRVLIGPWLYAASAFESSFASKLETRCKF
jgi:hypothetical protein